MGESAPTTPDARGDAAARIAALERELQRHRTALQVSGIGTWTRDGRTGAVEWSRELAELFGIDWSQAPRDVDSFFALVHPDDRARFASAATEAIRERRDYHVSFRYWHSSGEYRWMLGRGRGVYGDDGSLIELAGVGIDVTEEHRAREAADERASVLRQIGDNLHDGALYQVLAETDGTRRFLYWSAGIDRLLGISAEEAVSNPGLLYGLVHPEDAARLGPAEEKSIRELSAFDETVRIQHRQTREWRWVHLRSAPRRLLDGRVVWDGIYIDVTEQKRIEEALTRSLERLDLAQQAGHIGVFDWEVQSGRLLWNEEEQRIFGLAPGEFEGTIEAWSTRVVPEDVERMQREMGEAMARGDSQMSFAFRVVTPAGIRMIEGAGRFAYTPDGQPIRMVGVNIDVTERKEAERALQAADRRKGEFLAMLSHELRNPLAAISNALELASAKDLDPAAWEWSRVVMRRQMTHLTRLVDDLLDVTRITSGKIQLRTRLIDAADVLDSAAAALKPLFAERGQQLVASYDRGFLFVQADPTRLEQVLVNLLTNAAKYTERAGTIWVDGRREDGDVVLAIRDNGVGIAPEALGEMFELFAQGQRSIARSEGGLGLGLTIARTLVEMHGGRIVANSAGEGRGSEFIVRLPAASSSSATETTPVVSAPRESRAARILVVDDHVDTALSLARLLRTRRNIVEVAHEGTGALAAAESFGPDIVLLDLGLPGMDGYEVAERLRGKEEGRRAKIIAISGYGQEEDRRRSAAAGIDHHLVKPVRFSQLETLLAATAAA
jgi:PAS domain S-box-containing protein